MKLRLLCLAVSLLTPLAARAGTNGVAAMVNGRPVLVSEVEERTRALTQTLRRDYTGTELAAKLNQVYNEVLDTLIERELILKEYEPFAASNDAKVNALTDDDIKDHIIRDVFQGDRKKLHAELKAQGKTFEKFREERKKGLIVQMMLGQACRDDAPITSDEKNAYLKEHAEEFREGDAIKLWSITIPAEGEFGTSIESQRLLAVEVRNRLVKGADFGELARTHSTDSKSAAGGDWGWVTKKDLSRQLADRVFRLPAKQVSEVLPIDGQFYLFWVEARKAGQMKPADEVERELEARVKAARRKKLQDEYIEKLKRKAVIRRYPKK